MRSDVLEHIQLLLVLRLEEHPSQIYILKEQGAQRQGVALQCPVGAVMKKDIKVQSDRRKTEPTGWTYEPECTRRTLIYR